MVINEYQGHELMPATVHWPNYNADWGPQATAANIILFVITFDEAQNFSFFVASYW